MNYFLIVHATVGSLDKIFIFENEERIFAEKPDLKLMKNFLGKGFFLQ